MKIRHFSQIPKPYFRYPSILKEGFVKSFIHTSKDQVLPQVKYVVNDFYIEPKHLVQYNKVCGFDNDGNIPAIYFAVLSQTLQIYMMTEEDFPFSVLSLSHLENQITQYSYLPANQKYQLSCCFGQSQLKHNGVAFDFIIHVHMNNQLVMEGKTTYFQKQSQDQEPAMINMSTVFDFEKQSAWHIPENIGRRYAFVSGDFNLIHLHAMTAKVFGFNQAVAHGMWSKAKVMAQLNLPEKYTFDMTFKQPIDLPTSVQLKSALDQERNLNYFQLINEKNKAIHADGKWFNLCV